MDFSKLNLLINEHLNHTFPAAQIEIRFRGEIVYANAFGYLDPESASHPTTQTTKFDFASVSKLFTVAAFMTMVEEKSVALDQRVCDVLPEFSGEHEIAPYPDPLKPGASVEIVSTTNERADASRVTFRHLLAHNAGLPAWLPLWKIPQREQRRDAALQCSFAYPIGARVVYSDIGLILLGWAMEKLAAQSLAQIVRARVTAPLGLDSIGYGPISPENVAPTEFYAHQNRRMRGEVHDENAWSLGGVAGHAGLFGNAHDLASFGEALRTHRLLKPATLQEMTHLQAQDGVVRHGIGFALWSPDSGAASNPLSEQAFGHLGFTGTSLWIDPTRDLVIACLTNRVYYGRNNANEIGAFRVALHRTICEIVDGPSPTKDERPTTKANVEPSSSVIRPSSFVLRPSSSFVIGIDGGGTRCRARLANSHGETLGNGEAGTANPNVAGFESAQREILLAIQRAFEDAKIEKQFVTAICLGIGGVDRVEERARLQTWAEQNIAQHVIVVNDGEIVLAAGSPENWGVALIAGTGAIAWGKSRAGKVARAGGWGYLIGDEGSGFDLTRNALRAITQAADGRGKPTRLLDVILKHWHLQSPQELIPRVYRSGLKPADIAALAPLVVQVAREEDEVAQRLLEQTADALATMIIAVARALDLGADASPLALTGGLLLETELLRARLIEIAKRRGYHFAPVELVREPVAGAVHMACQVA